jgi:S-disulfanyl-L-cysteine oxidoreductase SoxD
MLVILFGCSALVVAGQTPRTAVIRSVWDGVYTYEQADRGKALYVTHCASCHGPDLRGRPPLGSGSAATNLSTSSSPPLRGYEFVANWTSLPLGSIRERIRLSMPQNAPGTLTRAMTTDITAFLLNANGYPSGTIDLSDDKALLDDILVEW